MRKSVRLLLVGAPMFLAATVVGCGETADEVTNSITCAEVCGRYADCFDADYDVDGCTDRCENGATANEARERRLESCDACIDERSCTEAFDCADECVGIVP
jgi:hypothetical protein